MGKAYGEAKEEYESFSPLHRLQAVNGRPSARYFIIHGDQDTRVHHNQSERFVTALRGKHAQVEAMFIPGVGHSWFTFAEDHSARRRVNEEPNATVAPALLRFLAGMS
jgi:dipeptidyl aminopeptidase/acylaminoacyl peptidase